MVDLANGGDTEARRMIRDGGRHVGEVLAGAVNLLNPPFWWSLATWPGPTTSSSLDCEKRCTATQPRSPRVLQVVPSTRGDRSGVIGSATMVLNHVLSPGAIDASLATKPVRNLRRR